MDFQTGFRNEHLGKPLSLKIVLQGLYSRCQLVLLLLLLWFLFKWLSYRFDSYYHNSVSHLFELLDGSFPFCFE